MKTRSKATALTKAVVDSVIVQDDNDASEDESTRAKVVEDEVEEDEDIFTKDFSSEAPSKLRVLNAAGNLESDPKYKGKKSSRKALKAARDEFSDGDESDLEDDLDEGDDLEGDDDIDSDEEAHEKEHKDAELGHMFEMEGVEYDSEDEFGASSAKTQKTKPKGKKPPPSKIEVDDDQSESEQDESDQEALTKSDDSSVEEDLGPDLGDGQNSDDAEDDLPTFSKTNVDKEVAKGQAIEKQRAIWDNLLELRIVLQKSLSKINQLPNGDKWSEFKREASEDASEVKKCQQNVTKLLEQLLSLRSVMLKKNPIQNEGDNSEDSDDEEAETPKKKRRKVDEFEKILEENHDGLKTWRNETIDEWNDRTRLFTADNKAGFTAFESSTLKQIEHILTDKPRLVKRTQLKRTAYEILGESDNEVSEDYNEEIFDDDDFYHQLLRELIERKTAGMTDPIALGQQWLQLQKMRSKSKKKVDTKASKGRKTRYDIHSKLVNFMAPTYPKSSLSEEAKTELFSSLFK